MKLLVGLLLLGMMLAFGCLNQCPEGYERYKFEGNDSIWCWKGNPCENCPSNKCQVLDIFPSPGWFVVACEEANDSGQFCDAVTPCETGECYKFEDKDTPVCFEGDPCSRCASGRCMILESYPMQVRCTDEEPPAGFCGWSTNGRCSGDADCVAGGCSGQVCQSKFEEPVITTCEYRECYNAQAYGLNCGCVNGQCQWN